MVINETKYLLSVDNYIPIESIKSKIVIGNTFNHDMKHFIGWQTRLNGKYNRTAAFTIASNGAVYKHFNPIYQSKFLGNKDIDNQTIVILIENDGWLLRDNEKNLFITWYGDIYNNPNKVIEKRWRGYNYWSSYNNKQVDSAINLAKGLCDEFYIPQSSISHNTKIDGIMEYKGVLYKSNIETYYTDLSPAWDCRGFKVRLENKN